MAQSAESQFWDFACDVYGRGKVAPALLRLERRDGVHVNVVLFCAWAGVLALGRLREEDFAAMVARIDRWHLAVVQSLRRLQPLVKKHLALSAEVYEVLLDDALLAERIEQAMLLVDFVQYRRVHAGGHCHQLRRVCQHLSRYFDAVSIPLGVRQQRDLLVLLQGLFVGMSVDEVIAQSQAVWSKRPGHRSPKQARFMLS